MNRTQLDTHAGAVEKRAELLGIAARQHGVIARSQATALGFSDFAIARRVTSGDWKRVDTSVFSINGSPSTWMNRVWTAFLSRPEALVSGRSAARLYDFPSVRSERPELLLPFQGNARSPLARIIRSRHYELVARQKLDGLSLTDRAETIFFLAIRSPVALVERWVDSQMAIDKLASADFDGIFARLTNARVPGLKSLRRIIGERDTDDYQPPTSELEHLLYRLLDDSRLPSSVRQLPIEFQQTAATVDAYIDSWRLIVEGDGRRWHTRKADFEKDRRRDNAAASNGIQVVRFSYRMLKSSANECVATLLNVGRHRERVQ